MKKIYVMAAFLGTGLFVFGQKVGIAVHKLNTEPTKKVISNNSYEKALGDVFWHENFDSIVAYDGADSTTIDSDTFWTIDNDDETEPEYGWIIGDTDHGWHPNQFAANFASSSGGSFAQVNNGNPVSDPATNKIKKNYSITSKPIDIAALAGGTEVLLTFEQYGALFFDEQFVEISLDGIDWENIYSNNHKPMLSTTSSSIYNNPETIEIDLEPYLAGGANAVQLRFGWTSQYPTDINPNAWVTYGWVIDDIQLVKKADYDLVYVSSDYHYTNAQYTQVPSDQVSEMTVSAVFKNQGLNNLTDIFLCLLEGTDTIAKSNPFPLLTPGTTDTLELTYTPDNTIGAKTYTLGLGLAETDDNPSNNLIAEEIKLDVNEFIYAADYYDFGAPVYDYELIISVVSGGVTSDVTYESVGVLYDIYTDRMIGGVDVMIQEGTGNEVFVGIQKYVGGTALWEPVGQEAGYEIQESDLGEIITIPFDTPFLLKADNTYRVYILTFGNEEVVLASAGETSQPTQVEFKELGGDYARFGNLYDIPIIRMNFDETVSTIENKMSNLNVSQNFPNPFANETTVLFNLKETAHVSYTVVDLTGKVVANVDKGATMAGNHEIIIDGSSFANGVYYLNINAGDSKVTRKMIVNK